MKVFCQRLILCVTFLTLTGLEFLNKNYTETLQDSQAKNTRRNIENDYEIHYYFIIIIILSSSIVG